jgi:two-component system OmpR family response regulator
MRILLVEDDHTLAKFILKGLREENYAADHAANGQDGLHLALTAPYDAAIVDIMLPGVDGLSLIQEMRRHHLQTPVIILSAKRSVEDRVRGLQTGSDDYLTKPFAISELLARLQALIRRSSGVAEPTSLSVGSLHIDLLSRRVERDGTPIDLQPKEYALLAYLMRNAGRVVTKTMIIENVWNYNFDPETNVVEARISKLRDKIDKPFESRLIHTIRGAGYVVKASD